MERQFSKTLLPFLLDRRVPSIYYVYWITLRLATIPPALCRRFLILGPQVNLSPLFATPAKHIPGCTILVLVSYLESTLVEI